MEFVSSFQDRHGRTRYRFRRAGKSFYFTAQPGEPLFETEYERCLAEYPPASGRRLPLLPLTAQLRDYLARRKMSAEGEFVYFLSNDRGLIKIGYSVALANRFAKLVTSSAYPIRLLAIGRGSRADEQALHRKFDGLRSYGEWFKTSPELRAVIERTKVENCLTLNAG